MSLRAHARLAGRVDEVVRGMSAKDVPQAPPELAPLPVVGPREQRPFAEPDSHAAAAPLFATPDMLTPYTQLDALGPAAQDPAPVDPATVVERDAVFFDKFQGLAGFVLAKVLEAQALENTGKIDRERERGKQAIELEKVKDKQLERRERTIRWTSIPAVIGAIVVMGFGAWHGKVTETAGALVTLTVVLNVTQSDKHDKRKKKQEPESDDDDSD